MLGTGECASSASESTIPSCTSDRKSTRLNSSHGYISYAVFCLKKKKKDKLQSTTASRSTTRSSKTTHSQVITRKHIKDTRSPHTGFAPDDVLTNNNCTPIATSS